MEREREDTHSMRTDFRLDSVAPSSVAPFTNGGPRIAPAGGGACATTEAVGLGVARSVAYPSSSLSSPAASWRSSLSSMPVSYTLSASVSGGAGATMGGGALIGMRTAAGDTAELWGLGLGCLSAERVGAALVR